MKQDPPAAPREAAGGATRAVAHAGEVLLLLALCGLAVGLWHWQRATWPFVTVERSRLYTALAVTVLYAGWLCWLGWRCRCRHARRNTRAAAVSGQTDERGWLVVHASQTGRAEVLARAAVAQLKAAGLHADLCSLAELDAQLLLRIRRALFVVSTTGEGDAPDVAQGFVDELMVRALPLPALRYGLLALGDRDYVRFCAFGRQLDGWLQVQGAQPLFERVELDDDDREALLRWRSELATVLPAQGMSPDPQAPGVDDLSLEPVGDWLRWRLEARCCLNPGSPGAPLVWLRLIPADDRARLLANWTAGDLAEIRCGVAAPATPLRRYSIASLPQDGGLELLVRESRHPDGRLGAGSAFLLQAMQAGDVLDLRLQALPAFHAPRGDSVPPMILIGNGSGMASLRALLRLRARQEQAAGRNSGRNCWLLYGERSKAHDQPFADELRDLQGRGVLTHLDLAFSREADAGAPRYVQDLLLPHADRLRRWVRVGAMFYVCGSAQGMAPGVDMALRAALGDAVVSRLFRERRIRREVY